ncbi:MAG: divalent cation transporter [Micavibrio sp.]|nr:divalent cation transporter [Micavibrio sp.]
MLVYGVLLSLCAGLAIPFGAFLARISFFKDRWKRDELRRGIIAFGAGALISAVAFVLVPEGAGKVEPWVALLSFAAGGLFFMAVDMALARLHTPASNFLAMMMDFVPEAIVLGALLTQNFHQGIFLAIIIGAQNMPEGYAAYTEMAKGTIKSKNKLLGFFFLVGLSGPVYVLLGTHVFVKWEAALGVLMLFCAGGILYLIFEDIAPRIAMKKHWLPPLGAIAGFMVGMAGYLYIQ